MLYILGGAGVTILHKHQKLGVEDKDLKRDLKFKNLTYSYKLYTQIIYFGQIFMYDCIKITYGMFKLLCMCLSFISTSSILYC